jgi:hypothetical protein
LPSAATNLAATVPIIALLDRASPRTLTLVGFVDSAAAPLGHVHRGNAALRLPVAGAGRVHRVVRHIAWRSNLGVMSKIFGDSPRAA